MRHKVDLKVPKDSTATRNGPGKEPGSANHGKVLGSSGIRALGTENRSTKKRNRNPDPHVFRFGNYNRYYGYRVGRALDEDPRLKCFQKQWFEAKDCLDIGCNEGCVTISIAQKFLCRKILGVDIDEGLIRMAIGNLKAAADAEGYQGSLLDDAHTKKLKTSCVHSACDKDASEGMLEDNPAFYKRKHQLQTGGCCEEGKDVVSYGITSVEERNNHDSRQKIEHFLKDPKDGQQRKRSAQTARAFDPSIDTFDDTRQRNKGAPEMTQMLEELRDGPQGDRPCPETDGACTPYIKTVPDEGERIEGVLETGHGLGGLANRVNGGCLKVARPLTYCGNHVSNKRGMNKVAVDIECISKEDEGVLQEGGAFEQVGPLISCGNTVVDELDLKEVTLEIELSTEGHLDDLQREGAVPTARGSTEFDGRDKIEGGLEIMYTLGGHDDLEGGENLMIVTSPGNTLCNIGDGEEVLEVGRSWESHFNGVKERCSSAFTSFVDIAQCQREGYLEALEIDKGISCPSPVNLVERVQFRQENVIEDFPHGNFLKDGVFDTVLCLSITKWIHLNWGDDGLIRLFAKIFHILRWGGILILEPQPWKSYQSKQHVSWVTRKNFKEIILRPCHFKEVLLDKIGFKSVEEVRQTVPNCSAGFNRALYLCTK